MAKQDKFSSKWQTVRKIAKISILVEQQNLETYRITANIKKTKGGVIQ